MKNKIKKSMTCIAVIKTKQGKIYMGGERRGAWDWGKQQELPEPKIRKINGFLIGGTGDADLLELVLDGFEPYLESGDIKQYLLFNYKKDLAKFLKQQGYRDEHDLLRFQSETELELILAKDSRLFLVNFLGGYNPNIMVEPSVISVGEIKAPFAIGCGDLPAMGVLKGKLLENGYNIRKDLELALQVACDISPGCGMDKPDIIGD